MELRTIAVAIAAMTLACGEDHDHQQEESIDVAACEHLTGTEVKQLTAAAARDAAPAVSSDHHRYEIALTDVTGGKGGFVSFAVAEPGDHAFFLDADVPVKLSDASGTAIAFEKSEKSSAECVEVKGRHVAHLEVGTVFLELGPAETAALNLVVEVEGNEQHDHE